MARINRRRELKCTMSDKKICLISSSGGHYEQLTVLNRLNEFYDIFFVTEKLPYSQKQYNTYYIEQLNRKDKKIFLKGLRVLLQSIQIFFREKPDVIISTGVLATIPMLLVGKLFHKRTIYIESFAKVYSPTKTGKLAYKFVDLFIIQWKTLEKYYPEAVYFGSIY